MTLPTTGNLSLSQVSGEHGGSLPLSMSSLLRGNASNLVHSNNTAIPATAPMNISAFRGTSRFGYYPTVIGLTGTIAENNRQFGVNTISGLGSMLYNSNFKGYNIGWFIWNEYDNTFGVSIATADLPQSFITSFGTAKSGMKTPTGFLGNFFGFSTWNVIHSSNPFTAVGTTDNSLIIL